MGSLPNSRNNISHLSTPNFKVYPLISNNSDRGGDSNDFLIPFLILKNIQTTVARKKTIVLYCKENT